jgi:hypothetical protein
MRSLSVTLLLQIVTILRETALLVKRIFSFYMDFLHLFPFSWVFLREKRSSETEFSIPDERFLYSVIWLRELPVRLRFT